MLLIVLVFPCLFAVNWVLLYPFRGETGRQDGRCLLATLRLVGDLRHQA